MNGLLDRTNSLRPGFWPTELTANLIAAQPKMGSPAISPNGRWIAYVQDFDRRADIWLLPTGGGTARLISADAPSTPPVPRTPFSGSYGGGIAWTPDSQGLIYTSEDDGKLHLVPWNGGRSKRITDGPGMHLSPSVAADGSFVAYFVDRGDVDDQLYVAITELRSAPTVTMRLTPAGVAAMDPQISPDGSAVACTLYPLNDRWAHESEIAIVNLKSRSLNVLTPGTGILNYAPRWSPDGHSLAFLSDRSGFTNVWTVGVEGGEPVAVAPGNEEAEDLCWSPNGLQLAFTTNRDAQNRIAIYDFQSRTVEHRSDTLGIVSDLVWSPTGNELVGVHQSTQRPTNLFVLDIQDDRRQWLTDTAIGGLVDPELFVEGEHVAWHSTDGLEVHGVLLAPKEINPNGHPVLVHIHGGPTSHYRFEWDPIAQYFVSRGWVVIKPNFRGSRGYGRRFTDLLHGSWCEGDLQDNIRCIDVLRERGLVDEDRVVAWGGSGGGLATFACLTMAPLSFAAGVALYGIGDFLSFPFQADRFARDLVASELGPRATNAALWRARSPITHVNNVIGPMLVLHGDIDKRVPPQQSVSMVEALRDAGKLVEFHIYEGEAHGWRKRSTIVDYIDRMESFLVRHVLDA